MVTNALFDILKWYCEVRTKILNKLTVLIERYFSKSQNAVCFEILQLNFLFHEAQLFNIYTTKF